MCAENDPGFLNGNPSNLKCSSCNRKLYWNLRKGLEPSQTGSIVPWCAPFRNACLLAGLLSLRLLYITRIKSFLAYRKGSLAIQGPQVYRHTMTYYIYLHISTYIYICAHGILTHSPRRLPFPLRQLICGNHGLSVGEGKPSGSFVEAVNSRLTHFHRYHR